jgi:hypothetical protein
LVRSGDGAVGESRREKEKEKEKEKELGCEQERGCLADWRWREWVEK